MRERELSNDPKIIVGFEALPLQPNVHWSLNPLDPCLRTVLSIEDSYQVQGFTKGRNKSNFPQITKPHANTNLAHERHLLCTSVYLSDGILGSVDEMESKYLKIMGFGNLAPVLCLSKDTFSDIAEATL